MAKARNNATDKQKAQKTASRKRNTKPNDNIPSDENASSLGDSMNDCVALCQEQRWREALILCRQLYKKAYEKNDTEMCTSLENARVKIEYSLRRQMAATLINASKQLLEKEFLLDVS